MQSCFFIMQVNIVIFRFRPFFFLYLLLIFLNNCGTIYVPQILPEGRGISRSEGQESIKIKLIPLTNKVIIKANEYNYIRRVIDSGDLNSAAKLISVDQAINEKLPNNNDPGPYKVGIGDELTISQMINVKDDTGFSKQIATRKISIADDGFASIIGIGRIPLAGLTQFEAEDLLYERLVIEEINPEFELFISKFESQRIYVTNNQESLKSLSKKSVYEAISNLITSKKKRKEIQMLSLQNFNLTHQNAAYQIDNYRTEILDKISRKYYKKKNNIKILHVTNFNERHNGRLFYNTGKRINNGLIRLNHSVLEFSDRDIVSYYRSLNDVNGSKKLNKKLIEVISNYVPDIIILGHADLIKKETLNFIKKNYPDIKIAQWFLDRMDTQWIANKKRFLDKIDMMDASFCTTEPKSLNIPSKYKVFYIPNPVDASFEKLENYKNKNFNNDVFFAMSHGVHRGVLKKGKFDQRENFINKLISETPNIRFDLYGMNGVQPVWADNYLLAISQSKIGLNLSQGKPAELYSSDRFAQLIGNGLLVMIDEKTKFGNFFKKDELVLYKNIDDLSSKIIKFSNDNKLRCKIAKKGRNKYFKYFNSTVVADFIINKTIGTKKKFYWENV